MDQQLSSYVKSLSGEDLKTYNDKLRVGDADVLPDPYALPLSAWSADMTSWPPISFANIFEYFVLTSGLYSDALEDTKFFIGVNDNGEFELKSNHMYYDQCQGQLDMTGRKILFIWV